MFYLDFNHKAIVRLVDGPAANSGRAEFWNGTSWGTVCHSIISREYFLRVFSDVFCRELGGYSNDTIVKHASTMGIREYQ